MIPLLTRWLPRLGRTAAKDQQLAQTILQLADQHRAESADQFAARHLGQPLLLLLFGAVVKNVGSHD